MVSGVILATPFEHRSFIALRSCPFKTLRNAAETVVPAISKLLSTCRMTEKNGASTSPGALTKLCTAVNKFKGDGFKRAVSNNPASLDSSILQRFYTAGFHAEGLPQGILLASLITLHKRGEIASKVGTSVKVGTEAKGRADWKEGMRTEWEAKKKRKKKGKKKKRNRKKESKKKSTKKSTKRKRDN